MEKWRAGHRFLRYSSTKSFFDLRSKPISEKATSNHTLGMISKSDHNFFLDVWDSELLCPRFGVSFLVNRNKNLGKFHEFCTKCLVYSGEMENAGNEIGEICVFWVGFERNGRRKRSFRDSLSFLGENKGLLGVSVGRGIGNGVGFQVRCFGSATTLVQRNPSFSTLNSDDINYFKGILGEKNVIQDEDRLSTANTDWMHKYRGSSKLLLQPRTTEEVEFFFLDWKILFHFMLYWFLLKYKLLLAHLLTA